MPNVLSPRDLVSRPDNNSFLPRSYSHVFLSRIAGLILAPATGNNRGGGGGVLRMLIKTG